MSGIVNIKIEPNFKRLGIKKGLLHVYLSDGDISSSALQVSHMDGILSTSVHIGNSDVVGEFVYENNEKPVDTISNMKHRMVYPKSYDLKKYIHFQLMPKMSWVHMRNCWVMVTISITVTWIIRIARIGLITQKLRDLQRFY